ncbi:DNA topoisomerase III [Marinobacteraceae bacterium S3BR75-40.1]
MRLYIAEKPSLGRAIAAVLPPPQQKEPGAIRCGDGSVVSWCIGHLLEPAEPAQYDAQWKQWRWERLPIFPPHWMREPRPQAKRQLQVLTRLVKEAGEIVHAGDPDREGQLLVDEVLDWLDNRKPVSRVLINDLNPQAVRQALAKAQPNSRFQALSASADARQRADWIYGINLSRACTLQQQARQQKGVFSVGRVQTPVLGLVVERDRTIEDFQPYPFYVVQAQLEGPEKTQFKARWIPSEHYAAVLDEEQRLTDQQTAEQLVQRLQDASGTITEAHFKERKEAPPLPLSLSALQIDAARQLRLSAQQTLEAAQSLYENHRLITYPRSDCRYLPEGHYGQRQGVLDAIAANLGRPLPEALDTSRLTRAWDDSKLDAHHAIIPTQRQHRGKTLTPAEAGVYDLVCRYYLMQFMPDAVHRDGRLECRIEGERFRARETGVIVPGWKALEPKRGTAKAVNEHPPLPRLKKDDPVQARGFDIQERQTQPPSPFTDATLLSAMTGIARFVSDPALRKTLRDTDGLGTEATRAGIIETLFKRDYLYKEGRWIHATDKARQFIEALPESVVKPDRTAHWESILENIRHNQADRDTFIEQLKEEIRELLVALGGRALQKDTPHCPQCRSPMRHRSGRYGEFWSCTRYPDCRGTRRIEDTHDHADGHDQAPVPCPHCYAPLQRRKGKHGWFWGCSRFPACRQTLADDDGVPVSPANNRQNS